MSAPKLLPCPFCGSSNVGFSEIDDYSFVICNGCGCGVTSTDTYPELDPVSAWNSRSVVVVDSSEILRSHTMDVTGFKEGHVKGRARATYKTTVKNAFMCGFAAAATYNDKVENDPDEEWVKFCNLHNIDEGDR